jgi:hypothetical protein
MNIEPETIPISVIVQNITPTLMYRAFANSNSASLLTMLIKSLGWSGCVLDSFFGSEIQFIQTSFKFLDVVGNLLDFNSFHVPYCIYLYSEGKVKNQYQSRILFLSSLSLRSESLITFLGSLPDCSITEVNSHKKP